MKRLKSIAIVLAILSINYSCQNSHIQKKQEKISADGYQKIIGVCPDAARKNILLYYFDGDCAICLGKASYIEKYAIAHRLKPVLIAKTLNPAVLQYNIKNLNIQTCILIEKNQEFEKELDFMKVTKVSVDGSMENYDKRIENNQ